MLIMRLGNQMVQPDAICSSCLLADHQGQPRWKDGKLKCGRLLTSPDQSREFHCINGAEVIEISASELPEDQWPEGDRNQST